MTSKICYLMVGVSGSGKSTAMSRINQGVQSGQKYVFSLDAIRIDFFTRHCEWGMTAFKMMRPDVLYASAFKYATENKEDFDRHVDASWRTALTADHLFVDNTNLTRKVRTRWVTEARAKGFTIIGVEVLSPLVVVQERQFTRGDKCVPKEVHQMYHSQQSLLLGSEVDFIVVVDGTETTGYDLYSVIENEILRS